MRQRALFVVESGWRGMREASLKLLESKLSVDMIIKGYLDRRTLCIIRRPQGLKLIAIRRSFFRPYLFYYLIFHKLAGDLKEIIVSKEKTKCWIERFGLEVKLLVETEKGYTLG